ncbi:hypothetical protein VHEMI10323 [[Torrubiella] hemipterigena]|uniref:Uncharacterized protein n=1 Tax=[Torrubiella] hemipterigena TaxID=1531966 RepID=A0A0A1TIH9_9HYPO|nr:hypothetical protein VHEMI10323 [[Torrubiella] hemipterigena]
MGATKNHQRPMKATDFNSLPPELVCNIIEALVVKIGILKAVKYRSVNKRFDAEIMVSICVSRVVNPYDPRLDLGPVAPLDLRARVLLPKATSSNRNIVPDPKVKAIAYVNAELDALVGHTSQDVTFERHLKIAKAVSHHYWRTSAYAYSTCSSLPGPEKDRAQTILCGAIVLGDLSIVRSLVKDFNDSKDASLPFIKESLQSSLAFHPIYGFNDNLFSLNRDSFSLNRDSLLFGYPLHLAAAWGHIDIVRYLLEMGADPRITTPSFDRRNQPTATWLLPARAPASILQVVDWRNADRSVTGSPLRVAVLAGHDDIARLLMEPEHRQDTDKVEFFQAILATARMGHLDILELLLNATEGKSLLAYPLLAQEYLRAAVLYKNTALVNHLLSLGICINTENDFGRLHGLPCALSIASKQGNTPMVRLLLSKGADATIPNHPTIPDYTATRPTKKIPIAPVECAAFQGHQEIVSLLLNHGASVAAALLFASLGSQSHLVSWLCQQYPSVVQSDPSSEQPTAGIAAMYEAIKNLNPHIVKTLATAGVSLNESRFLGITLLDQAKAELGSEAIELLLSCGVIDADPPPQGTSYNRKYGTRFHACGRVSIAPQTWEWAGRY